MGARLAQDCTTSDHWKVTSDLSCDVLVVGAGPAGSGTAAWAARHGLDVLLTDVRGYPIAGGLSRTAVNAQAGARTGLAGVFTAVLVATTLMAPGPCRALAQST